MALQVALADAGDLVGERGDDCLVIVEAGEAEDGERDGAVMVPDDLLRRRLGLRVGPFGMEWPVLVDRLARRAGLLDQHRARIDELLDLEPLEPFQQPPRPLDVERGVERVLLTREVEKTPPGG